MKRICLLLVLFATLLSPAFGTNIKIPTLDITTQIYGFGGELIMTTSTQMDIVVEGGYKFGGKIVLGFDGFVAFPYVEQTMPILTFKAVSLTARDIFGSALDFSYFVGINDYVCYGDDFSRLFGTPFIQSNYKASYGTGIGPAYYKGLHRINGNGIKLEYFAPEEPLGFSWYLYQDQNFVQNYLFTYDVFDFTDPAEPVYLYSLPIVNLNIFNFDVGYFSTDVRFFLNFEGFKLEATAGGTIDSGTGAFYARFGALLYFGVEAVDFLIEAGIPKLDFSAPFGLDLFYILFESRINIGPVSIIPTVFFRPSQYLQQATGDDNKIDFNLNLGIFNPRRDFISFGFEGNFQTAGLLTSPTPAYALFVLPYVTLATPGVYWELKLRFTLLDSTTTMSFEKIFESIQGLISIRAEF